MSYQWLRDRVKVGTLRDSMHVKLQLKHETLKAFLFSKPGTSLTLWIPKTVANIVSVGEDPCTVSIPRWFKLNHKDFFNSQPQAARSRDLKDRSLHMAQA